MIVIVFLLLIVKPLFKILQTHPWFSLSDENEHKVYVTSLSNRTIVYKGILTPVELSKYIPDLNEYLAKEEKARTPLTMH